MDHIQTTKSEILDNMFS